MTDTGLRSRHTTDKRICWKLKKHLKRTLSFKCNLTGWVKKRNVVLFIVSQEMNGRITCARSFKVKNDTKEERHQKVYLTSNQFSPWSISLFSVSFVAIVSTQWSLSIHLLIMSSDTLPSLYPLVFVSLSHQSSYWSWSQVTSYILILRRMSSIYKTSKWSWRGNELQNMEEQMFCWVHFSSNFIAKLSCFLWK